MSNAELSEKKANQERKGKHKPIPKFMSMTWLRLHMKVIIIAVTLTFLISLFFIGYGTHVQNSNQEKREAAYKAEEAKEISNKFALPNKIKDKANTPVVFVSYNTNTASFTTSIDAKTLCRAIRSTEEYSRLSQLPEGLKKYYIDSIKESVIDSLIKFNLVDLYAKANNLVTAENLNNIVDNQIKQYSQNPSSDFNYNLAKNGLTLQDFKQEQMKRVALQSVYQQAIVPVATSTATEDYLKSYYESHKDYFKKDNKISFDHLLITPSELIDSVKVDDNQINSYYESNKNTFVSTERALVYHIFIKTDANYVNSIAYSESDIQKTYNETKNTRFVEPEQVRARHILIKPRGEGDQDQQFEEAKKVIQAIYEKAKNGEDFAKLATENSEDEGSAKNGGDLDFFGRNMMVKEFEDAAFSTAIGSITEPIKTKFGYHIIKVEAKNPEKVKSYEEVKEILIKEAKEKLADTTASDLLEKLRNELYGSDLNKFIAAAEKNSKGNSAKNKGKLPTFFKGEITDDYTAEDKAILIDEISDGYNFIVPEIEEEIFNKLKPGEISEVIKSNNGYHLFRLEGFANPIPLKLTETLKNKIKDILLNQEAEKEAEKVAKDLFANHNSASISEMATAYGKEDGEKKHSYTEISFSENPGANYNLFEGMGKFSDNGRFYLPEFHQSLLDAVKGNKLNTYLTPFKTQFGWNIVKVTNYETNLYDPFENCRDTIRRIVTLEPTDAEINKYYEENKSQYDTPAKRTIRQIICDKNSAEKVYDELTHGAGFSMLARTYSSDSSASNGGLMYAAPKGTYSANLDEAIWNLKVGEYTKPIETPYGWVVAMVESETPEVKGTLNGSVIASIKKSFSERNRQEAWSYFIKGLMDKAYIVRNQELINEIE